MLFKECIYLQSALKITFMFVFKEKINLEKITKEKENNDILTKHTHTQPQKLQLLRLERFLYFICNNFKYFSH